MHTPNAIWSLAAMAFYVVTGLAFHLVVYGEVVWSDAFTYVAMLFWPLLLAWELLKIVAIVLLVVAAGLGLYLLIRPLMQRLRGNRV